MTTKRKPLIFVKLGGAAITFKDLPKKANDAIIDSCAQQIANLKDDYKFLIGHGGGGFAHPIAAKYRVHEGLKIGGAEGMTETHRAMSELNSIVVNYLMDRGIPAFSVFASSCAVSNNGQIKDFYTKPIKELLTNNVVPVIGGDVVRGQGNSECPIRRNGVWTHRNRRGCRSYDRSVASGSSCPCSPRATRVG